MLENGKKEKKLPAAFLHADLAKGSALKASDCCDLQVLALNFHLPTV